MHFPQEANLDFLPQNICASLTDMRGPKLWGGWEATSDWSLCAHIIETKSHTSQDYTCVHNYMLPSNYVEKALPIQICMHTKHLHAALLRNRNGTTFFLKKKSPKRTKKAYVKVWLTAAIMDCHVKRTALLILLHNELDARLSLQVWLCTLPSILPTSWHLKYSKTT